MGDGARGRQSWVLVLKPVQWILLVENAPPVASCCGKRRAAVFLMVPDQISNRVLTQQCSIHSLPRPPGGSLCRALPQREDDSLLNQVSSSQHLYWDHGEDWPEKTGQWRRRWRCEGAGKRRQVGGGQTLAGRSKERAKPEAPRAAGRWLWDLLQLQTPLRLWFRCVLK